MSAPRMAEQDEQGAISLARQEAHREGHKEGHKLGLAEARAGNVLTVVRVRGVPVSETARERILAEKNLPSLERWHERAILAHVGRRGVQRTEYLI